VEPNKPPYIDPAGDPRQGALPAAPPFVFRAVTSRVFPLKANGRLRAADPLGEPALSLPRPTRC
jgi:hypothetical protein